MQLICFLLYFEGTGADGAWSHALTDDVPSSQLFGNGMKLPFHIFLELIIELKYNNIYC